MSYKNFNHQGRLVVIDVAKNVFSDISTSKTKWSVKTPLSGTDPEVYVYVTEEPFSDRLDCNIYNMPFLFLADRSPWKEANSFLVHLVRHKHPTQRPTDAARKSASKILNYKLFCEKEGLDWLDFSAKRPRMRPTYRYFKHLVDSGEISANVINQYTGAIFDFYKFVIKHWHYIDIDRVDTTKQIKFLIKGRSGAQVISVTKRSQTKATPPTSTVQMGYIRDDGEDLRPLTNSQLKEFTEIIQGKSWSVQERLIIQLALFTGARKQSILTFRMKHLKAFDQPLNPDGTYTLNAGPGTGIDTKNDTQQKLYIPKQLAEDIAVFVNSRLAKVRRIKFLEKYKATFPDLPVPSHEDHYIFFSDQGGCYYMSKDDLRYPMVKSPQIGQVTDNLRRKLFRFASKDFPHDFTFHWLRATFAYQYYQWLSPYVDDGSISLVDQMSMIQRRLHHKSRETTEHYLKLFNNQNEKLAAQEKYEGVLFGDLSLILEDGEYGK